MKKKHILRWLIILIMLCLVIWLCFSYPDYAFSYLDTLQSFKTDHPLLAPLAFIGLYIAVTAIVVLPVSLLTLLGGWLFGAWYGAILNMTGASIGAALAFLISRYIAHDWVANHISGRLRQIRNGVTREGWRFVALLRLAPVLPFNVINSALGLTDIRFKTFLITTFICMMPSKVTYSYVGSLGADFIRHPTDNLLVKITLVIGLLIVGVCLPSIIKRIQQEPH